MHRCCWKSFVLVATLGSKLVDKLSIILLPSSNDNLIFCSTNISPSHWVKYKNNFVYNKPKMSYLDMHLKSFLNVAWDSFHCSCTVDLVFFFVTVPVTLEISASFEMLPSFIFLPIVMEIHPLNCRQYKFQQEFGAIVTLQAIIFVSLSPLGGRKLPENQKALAHKTCSRENVQKVMWGWYDFVAMETELTHHLFVICFYRIRRRSRLRPEPSCASSVCHHELRCMKTCLYVVVMMPVRVIIINQIKLYCQK